MATPYELWQPDANMTYTIPAKLNAIGGNSPGVYSYASKASGGGGGREVNQAIQTGNQVNSANLNYVRGGQESDPTWQMVQNLLNQNWGVQAYDSAQASAEDSVNRGISGSNLANFRGARQYSGDLIRNALTASQLLSSATSRLPQPFDIGSQIISPAERERLNLEYARLDQQSKQEAARLAQQLKLQGMSDDAAMKRAILEIQSRFRGGGSYGGGGASVASAKPQVGYDGGGGGGYTPSQYDFTGNSLEGGFGGYGEGGGSLEPSPSVYDWSADYGDNSDWWNQDLFGATGGQGYNTPNEPDNYYQAPSPLFGEV